jgi:hypothetical protein
LTSPPCRSKISTTSPSLVPGELHGWRKDRLATAHQHLARQRDNNAGGAKPGPLPPLLRPRLHRAQPQPLVPSAGSSSKAPGQGAPSNRWRSCETGCAHRYKPRSFATRTPPLSCCIWPLLQMRVGIFAGDGLMDQQLVFVTLILLYFYLHFSEVKMYTLKTNNCPQLYEGK